MRDTGPGRRGSVSSMGVTGALLFALAFAAILLVADLFDGRNRILAERADMALQKSQFMSQWFGTTIVATDYVLRDIIGKVSPDDLVFPDPDPRHFQRMQALSRDKLATLPGVEGITLYDKDCVFTASANPKLVGFRSNQKFCTDKSEPIGPEVRIQYIPMDKSATRRPMILVSRNLVSADGHLQGGALAAIDLALAQDWISSFAVGPNDVLALVDSDGTLLARNPPLPQAIGTRSPSPPGQPTFGETRSSASFTAMSPLDGRERIFGISKIENIPVLLIVGYDKNGTLHEWERRTWQLSAGFVILLALSLVVRRSHRRALAQREEMRKLATTDTLTGIANRRQVIETGEHEVARAHRYGHALSALILDIDHFKAINDIWGHPTGDLAIQSVAKAMTSLVRDQDTAGRLGGEEFATILPETDAAGAAIMAERLRQSIEAATSTQADGGTVIRFTVSIGTATLNAQELTFDSLLNRADKALYQAKGTGRNRVMAAE
jgi:diguanylate cyclase (GGDEF)-like protein